VARKSKETDISTSRLSDRRIQIALGVAIAAAVAMAGLFGFYRWEQFLIRDARFAAIGSDGAGSDLAGSMRTDSERAGSSSTVAEPSSIEIQGVTHASRRAIESVFAEDLGRSVYLLPLSGRRDTVRTVDWVKDAAVARVWPNRVLVHVTERQPVAFVTLAPSRFGLIDAEGVVLPPVTARFHLPVLKGVRPSDPEESRRERVQRMLRLLHDLGDGADKVSEVDASDRENMKITEAYEGRMVTLHLGDQNFSVRYHNFTSHFAEIRQKLPQASTLDLRLEDRITVIDQ
jgi:POTRA domain, FtsQ-type/Cell division protein FtsQ